MECAAQAQGVGQGALYRGPANPSAVPAAIEVVEFPFNLLMRDPATEILPLAKKKGLGVLARSPFASGGLHRKGRDAPANAFRFLAKKGRPLTVAAIKYVLAARGRVLGGRGPDETVGSQQECRRLQEALLNKGELNRVGQL